MSNQFRDKWEKSTDSDWLTALIQASKSGAVQGVNFPKLASAEIQRQVHGSLSAEVAIRGAYRFYVEARLATDKAQLPFSALRQYLDFGTGWGRIIHPFMRHFDLDRITGTEPSLNLYSEAKKLNPHVNFVHSEYRPPLPAFKEKINYITAYSIFSHLPEDLFKAWFAEFHKILDKDGLVFFTVLGEKLVRELSAEKHSNRPDIRLWHKILIDHIPDIDTAHTQLARGELLYFRTQSSDTYGGTFMSPAFIKKALKGKFEIVHTNLVDMAQDFICVRKIQARSFPSARRGLWRQLFR